MGTGPRPKEEPAEALSGAQSEDLDADTEILMEKLLATCLALPGRRVDSAIEETCREHPHLAPHLRHRYVNLLQMGILEHHEEDDLQSEEAS